MKRILLSLGLLLALTGGAFAQCVGVGGINGTSPSSGLVNVTFEWTEAAQ